MDGFIRTDTQREYTTQTPPLHLAQGSSSPSPAKRAAHLPTVLKAAAEQTPQTMGAEKALAAATALCSSD